MSQINNDNTKRPKPKENQLGILGISSREFTHYVGNSADGRGPRRECCWGYVSNFENFCLIFHCLICFCLIFVYFVNVIIYKGYNM